ncbi:hypothetical protein [Saccharolobus islandicus]|uniref:Uncharacterized protein n=1 Tax=Saccharolobus islandicus LAL14/1 TaxID=1241935 RepID=M9U877_SACIS|nr:hypothetical protein [Sulfolobus islandicus]AGJ62327.1 Hypothetical Protein SiL_0873 [Sulfolobus islandicus LAL14/1]
MKYLRLKLRVYYGYKKEILPSTTLAGALTQFYAINGEYNKDINFGFSDFTLIDKFVSYQSRVNLGRVYYSSFPYIQKSYLSKRKVYGEYVGCVVGDLEEGRREAKNLILINFSEVEEVKVDESKSDFYALAIPVINIKDAKTFGDIVRIRFLRFHGLNDIEQHPVYVLEGESINRTNEKVIKLVDVKLTSTPKEYNILLDLLNTIEGLDKAYMKMAHGVVIPKECVKL